jgi:RecA-family ATPase
MTDTRVPADLSIPPFLKRTDDDEAGPPPISLEAYDKLGHWRDQLKQTPKLNKRSVFERAADDLFLAAEFEHDLGACQAISDAVYFLGRDHAALDDDSIQFVMVGAKIKAERPSNGHDTKPSGEPPPAISAAGEPGTTPDPSSMAESAGPIEETHKEKTPKPLLWLDMSTWDDEPRPEREWAILNRVPLKQAGLFSGEGGAGKSIIEMMKDVAHVTAKDWLGSLPEPGPAWYLGAEDDEKEIHIRFYDIARHYGVTFKELIDGGLKVLCLLGQDATLCAATGKSGKVEVTALYRQLYEQAADTKPKNISVDTLSRAFAGSELDRVQVYAFAMHMQALAMVANGSVTVLSHPSLSGIASGSGISGSTAWHGAFRFRQYLKGVRPDGGEQPDGDLRELEFKKNQYGPTGETIVLRYQRGLFLPVAGVSSLDRAAQEQTAEHVFLDLLKHFTAANRSLSDKPSSIYAPTLFARENEAKKAALNSKLLEGAMRRLFADKKIWNEPCGRPSRPRFRIAIKT